MTIPKTITEFRERVDPSEEEQTQLEETVSELKTAVQAALDNRELDARIVQAGSTARGTYVTGDRDIDLFICFPTSVPETNLEQHALDIGHEVIPDATEDFASHPYIKGTFNEFDIDLVPCYDIDDASNIKSAVDRTPFHTDYLSERMADDFDTSSIESDVRVAKYFLKQIGVYGSDDETEGFSGYLTELLVLEAGGFHNFLEMVSEWDKDMFIDPENHLRSASKVVSEAISEENPLHVVDPVDPGRNVADILSKKQYARLQHHARKFLESPEEYLTPPSADLTVYDPVDIIDIFQNRGLNPVAIVIDRPEEITREDLVPQIKRSLNGTEALLDEHGFTPTRSDWFLNPASIVLFLEVTPTEKPAVETHLGPPVSNKAASEGFLDKHRDSAHKVYITDDGRYAAEIQTEFRTATEVIDKKLDTAAHGSCLQDISGKYRTHRPNMYTYTVNDFVDTFQEELSQYLQTTL